MLVCHYNIFVKSKFGFNLLFTTVGKDCRKNGSICQQCSINLFKEQVPLTSSPFFFFFFFLLLPFLLLLLLITSSCLSRTFHDDVCFLLGNSLVSEFYMPTIWNTLSHLHRQVGVKNKPGLRNAGVFKQENVWLKNSLSQQEGDGRGGSEYRKRLWRVMTHIEATSRNVKEIGRVLE